MLAHFASRRPAATPAPPHRRNHMQRLPSQLLAAHVAPLLEANDLIRYQLINRQFYNAFASVSLRQLVASHGGRTASASKQAADDSLLSEAELADWATSRPDEPTFGQLAWRTHVWQPTTSQLRSVASGKCWPRLTLTHLDLTDACMFMSRAQIRHLLYHTISHHSNQLQTLRIRYNWTWSVVETPSQSYDVTVLRRLCNLRMLDLDVNDESICSDYLQQAGATSAHLHVIKLRQDMPIPVHHLPPKIKALHMVLTGLSMSYLKAVAERCKALEELKISTHVIAGQREQWVQCPAVLQELLQTSACRHSLRSVDISLTTVYIKRIADLRALRPLLLVGRWWESDAGMQAQQLANSAVDPFHIMELQGAHTVAAIRWSKEHPMQSLTKAVSLLPALTSVALVQRLQDRSPLQPDLSAELDMVAPNVTELTLLDNHYYFRGPRNLHALAATLSLRKLVLGPTAGLSSAGLMALRNCGKLESLEVDISYTTRCTFGDVLRSVSSLPNCISVKITCRHAVTELQDSWWRREMPPLMRPLLSKLPQRNVLALYVPHIKVLEVHSLDGAADRSRLVGWAAQLAALEQFTLVCSKFPDDDIERLKAEFVAKSNASRSAPAAKVNMREGDLSDNPIGPPKGYIAWNLVCQASFWALTFFHLVPTPLHYVIGSTGTTNMNTDTVSETQHQSWWSFDPRWVGLIYLVGIIAVAVLTHNLCS